MTEDSSTTPNGDHGDVAAESDSGESEPNAAVDGSGSESERRPDESLSAPVLPTGSAGTGGVDAETGVQDQESSGALDEMPSGRGIEGVSTTSPPEPAVPAAAPNTPVSAAVARLDTLSSRPLAEHPDVYQSIHADLQGALADIDDA